MTGVRNQVKPSERGAGSTTPCTLIAYMLNFLFNTFLPRESSAAPAASTSYDIGVRTCYANGASNIHGRNHSRGRH